MQALETKLGYTFRRPALLENALYHSSYANEHRAGGITSNERLEFLGDAVLGFVTAEYLYAKHPDLPEGDLTRIRAALVCEESLHEVAQYLELGQYLKLGHGEELGGGRQRPSILADATGRPDPPGPAGQGAGGAGGGAPPRLEDGAAGAGAAQARPDPALRDDRLRRSRPRPPVRLPRHAERRAHRRRRGPQQERGGAVRRPQRSEKAAKMTEPHRQLSLPVHLFCAEGNLFLLRPV